MKKLAVLNLAVDFRSRHERFAGGTGSLLTASAPAGSPLPRTPAGVFVPAAKVYRVKISTMVFNTAKRLESITFGFENCLAQAAQRRDAFAHLPTISQHLRLRSSCFLYLSRHAPGHTPLTRALALFLKNLDYKEIFPSFSIGLPTSPALKKLLRSLLSCLL